MKHLSVQEILDANPDRNAGCIESATWNTKDGYGRIVSDGKRTMAHRIAYELAHGPIPDGLLVRHKCDNPPCINPDHLEIGTHLDNMADRRERLRGPRGHAVHTSRLTEEQVADIRERVSGGESRRSVSRAYGVSHTAVNDIIKGKNWRHFMGGAQ